VDRTAALSTTRWDDRFAALDQLAQVSDPAAFAQASANTSFGAIDVFVLKKKNRGWVWAAPRYSQEVVFSPGQFDRTVFDVDDTLPNNTVVAVRRHQ
jgi:hypothetical protein